MRYEQLPAAVFQSNRERLVAELPEKSLAILNSNDVMPSNADGSMGFCQNSNLYYLSGVDQEETILLLFPSAADPKQREILFVRETSELIAVWEGAKLTKEQASEVSGVETVHWTGDFDRVLGELMVQAETVYLDLNEHLRNSSEVETRSRRFADQLKKKYPLHSYARLAPLLYRLRMVKSPEEIQAIRQATVPTEAGFRRLLGFVKPGVKEYEVEAELVHEYIRGRSRGFSYSPIIASGANACVLHYVENNATCEDGDLLLLDVAAEYANYRSDMTRTIPVSGKFTSRQREVYDAVLRVLRGCSPLLTPGKALKTYQAEAARLVEKELIGLGLFSEADVENQDKEKPLYRKYFMHGMSHHIGIDVHDVNDASLPFAAGMVLSVEPGIYIAEEGIGIRLENLIVVGESENEDLMVNVPIEADEIQALMQR